MMMVKTNATMEEHYEISAADMYTDDAADFW